VSNNEYYELWATTEFAAVFFKYWKKPADQTKAHRACLKAAQTHLKRLLKSPNLQQELTESNFKASKVDFLTLYAPDSTKQERRLKQALERLKNYVPDGYERLRAFTHVIVAEKEKTIVSFSSQNLPGFSHLNLYHRDDLDLMDDLLHENGHHHLNYYLNLEELIEESDERIFYSPWRESLRPLRGIYHGFFTFYWRMDLFAKLLKKNPPELKKYRKRLEQGFAEEFLFLNYTWDDLVWAKKEGMISPNVFKIITQLQKELKKFKPLYLKHRNKKLETLLKQRRLEHEYN
jgi:hypothetical protein